MTTATILTRLSMRLLYGLIFAAGLAAQGSPTILQVDVENWVNYTYDTADASKLATTPGPLTVNMPLNFAPAVVIADITAVNGSPVKGTMVMIGQNVQLRTSPTSGQAIADITRGQWAQFLWEFLKPDGSPFGSIFTTGLSGGVPAPGSPLVSSAGNNAIIGGTGAYLGARGTVNAVQVPPTRATSQVEDPSMRRINGGGSGRFVLQIIPMVRPEVVITPSGPSIFHADFSLVTADSPAKPGEVLILYARGLGPTTPGVNPGDPFPEKPFAVVTSPVEVIVAGKVVPAINQLGAPGTPDTYRIDFQVPSTTTGGSATIQISAAWVKGTAITIPIR